MLEAGKKNPKIYRKAQQQQKQPTKIKRKTTKRNEDRKKTPVMLPGC